MNMINRRIATGLMSIAGALAIAGGATFAYFSDSEVSANNTFVAGSVNINIDQNESGNVNPVISNWAPGETTQVRFDVNNTGTLPVHLRGFAVGNWDAGVTDPDPTLVKVVSVEYYNEGSAAWLPLASNSSGFTGPFYYSSNGLDSGTMFALAPGASEEFRLTVELDDATPNKYQGKTFTAQVTVDAKQTNAPAFE